MQKHTQKPMDNKIYGVYLKSLLNQKITLTITEIGNNLKQNLEKKNRRENRRKMYRSRIYKTELHPHYKLF